MKTHTVIVACDQPEAEEFAAWLNAQGHIAATGNDTATWVDGERDSDIAERLWEDHCNQ